MTDYLNIHDVWGGRCPLLGRALFVWVQGCPRRCPGCFNVETLDEHKIARTYSVTDLAEACLTYGGGVVLSGGEPFSQSEALVRVCQRIREVRPETEILAYSGFEFEALLEGPRGDLLRSIDVLIDGPFVRERLTSHPLLGSDNQQLFLLSKRVCAERVTALLAPQVQLELSADRRLRIVGTAGPDADLHGLMRQLRRHGLHVRGACG